MARAIDLAIENVRTGGGPFAAVVVKDGRIVAEGTNRVTSSNDPTAHAEVVAIRAACTALRAFQLDGCDLYTTCEPCPMCLGAIYWARPARVYFGSLATRRRRALTTRSSTSSLRCRAKAGRFRSSKLCGMNRLRVFARGRKNRTEWSINEEEPPEWRLPPIVAAPQEEKIR